MGVRAPQLFNQARADNLAAHCGYDVLVATQSRNVYYLSGHDSDWLFDVPRVSASVYRAGAPTLPTLVVHDVELTAIAECSPPIGDLLVYQLRVCGTAMPHYTIDREAELDALERRCLALTAKHTQSSSDGVLTALKALLAGDRQGLVIVFDDQLIANWINDNISGVECVYDPVFFSRVRMVKSANELALMRNAAELNAQALTKALQAVTHDTSWQAVERTYRTACESYDARPYSLYVGAGRRSAGLHLDKTYRIQAGDHACFDAMLTWKHYFADMQRTCTLGPPGQKLVDYYAAVQRGSGQAVSAMQPGVSTGQIRDIAVDVTQASGCPSFQHAFVHGLGLTHIELPFETVFGFQDFVLEEGMVVNLDMELCELGFGGVYLEDTYLIKASGAERLTSLSRELIQL
jgi:Xaa-Pro aminopeptidase